MDEEEKEIRNSLSSIIHTCACYDMDKLVAWIIKDRERIRNEKSTS